MRCCGCNNYGHYPSQCKNKTCNYCKAPGHVISICQKRPKNLVSRAYNATITTPATFEQGDSSSTIQGSSAQSVASAQSDSSISLTPELVQQMIINVFSAIGLSGKVSTPSSTWYFDSGTTNNMTSPPSSLTNIVDYKGNLRIQTTNGENLHITAIGDVISPLPIKDVFVSQKLTTNLVSVGQLFDNKCKDSFSSSSCVVQDQESGKVIARRPREGRLFSLYMPSSMEDKPTNKLLCFFCFE